MNPRIDKLRTELQKNKNKITHLQNRNHELDKQIRELENTDIIGMVRERGLTPEQLMELLCSISAPKEKREEPDDENT